MRGRAGFAPVCLLLGAAPVSAQMCRTQYDLPFARTSYAHPQLRDWVSGVAGARLADSVAAAKAGGYPKEVAYELAIAQAQSLDGNVEQSIRAAEALSSYSGDLGTQLRAGLPASYNCDGAASMSVCAAQIFYWQALLSRQTAEGIECLW